MTDDRGAAAFIHDRGIEIAIFMDTFIRQHNIPLLSPDRKSGGIALLGWSLGAAYVHSALSHLYFLPEPVRMHLAGYLHTVLIHGAYTIG